jgi:hypothetical protein
MRCSLAILAALLLLGSGIPAVAFEPGTDDTRAGMCDTFEGVAFTFCVAYCEARECDRQPLSDERCTALRRGFDRVAEGLPPPCVRTAFEKPNVL